MADRTPRRSFLYVPGSSHRLLERVLDRGADAVVLDLEDAVAPVRKTEAREAVVAFLDAHADVAGPELHVRCNGGRYGFDQDDISAIVRPGLDVVRVPKCDDPGRLRLLDRVLTNLERERGLPPGGIAVHALIESARGVHVAPELAKVPRVTRLCFGATDFLGDIGGSGATHGEATWYARSALVVASRVAGIEPPVDSVHTLLEDEDGLREGAQLARRLGFGGKSVIHPRQLAVVHEVFSPDAEEVAWARRVLAAAEASHERGEGASQLAGEFIDEAVVGRASHLLELAPGEGSP